MRAKRKQSEAIRNRIKFYAFLSENDAYYKWLENRKKYDIAWGSSVRFSSFFAKCNESEYIVRAFIWTYTPEGCNYWDNLDMLWKREWNMK